MQNLVVGQAVDGQVLTELAIGQVVAPEVPPPVLIGLNLVDEHGPLLAAVALRVALAVTVDIETADHPRPGNRLLPDTRMNGLAVPRHVLRHPDIDRKQHRHPALRTGATTGGRRISRAAHALVISLPGIGSASAIRHSGAPKGSPKYCVSCATCPRANCMMLTE